MKHFYKEELTISAALNTPQKVNRPGQTAFRSHDPEAREVQPALRTTGPSI